jgi:hypothetical protein
MVKDGEMKYREEGGRAKETNKTTYPNLLGTDNQGVDFHRMTKSCRSVYSQEM